MHFQNDTKKLIVIFVLLCSTAGMALSVHAEETDMNRYLKEIQTKLLDEGISANIESTKIDLCKKYSMPNKLCNPDMVVQSILSTGKLSMRRNGDVKAKAERSLKASLFDRDEESVHTYDDGLYFYQCAEWSRKRDRISLHVIGINEHPSVGWFFWAILSSSPCDVPGLYKGIGY